MTRNEARVILMQILYEMEVGSDMNEETACSRIGERLAGNHVERGQELLTKIIRNIDEIDAEINESSTRWKTSRMPKVDLSIMRLAVGEMKYCDDIPDAVSVNEAINLGRKFSTEHSARFIHGVLGAVSKKEHPDE